MRGFNSFLDCIECMACSDNVVRAGLTPKYKDVETLCEMLNYKGDDAGNKVFKPVVEDEFSEAFLPPVPDFAVVKIEVCKLINFVQYIYYFFSCYFKKLLAIGTTTNLRLGS